MTELKEVFEMVTKQADPDRDSWKQQEKRQRRTTRNRRVGAIVLVAAMIVALVAVFGVSRPLQKVKVAHTPSPATEVPFETTPPIGPQIIGLDGAPMLQLPGPFAGSSGHVPSPDGASIAYMVLGDVSVVGADGSNDRTLTDGGNRNDGDAMNHISWSPDGSMLAYAWDGEIFVMNADGSDKQQLTQSDPGTGSYYPAWSPDGSSIAYWSGSSTGEDAGPSDAEIYRIPATGGTPDRLTNDDVPDIEPTWSPDSTQIAFRHGDALRLMRADGSGPHDVESVAYDFGPWAPAWSPDGTMIAFLVVDPTGRSITNGPLLDVRVLTVATGDVSRLGVRVETDLNGPSWAMGDALLINRYD